MCLGQCPGAGADGEDGIGLGRCDRHHKAVTSRSQRQLCAHTRASYVCGDRGGVWCCVGVVRAGTPASTSAPAQECCISAVPDVSTSQHCTGCPLLKLWFRFNASESPWPGRVICAGCDGQSNRHTPLLTHAKRRQGAD